MAESLNYGLNVESREYDGRNKYIRITDINDVSRKFTPDPITSPNVDISELNDDYKLQLGDVLFARTGASVGKTYHYESSDGNLYYAGFLIRARIKTAFSSMFLYQFTWGQKYKRFVNITSQRSGQPGINAKEYGNLTLLLPNYKEQQKIGEFFRKLDRTITLQQRKLELLKKLKQGYLQQMFPAKNQDTPRLRFSEYNGDWEQRKFFDNIKSTVDFRGRTPKKLGMDWSDSGYLALSALNVKNGYIDSLSDAHYGDKALYDKWMKGKELHKGQVLFTTEAPMGNVAQVPDNNKYILSQRTIAFKVIPDKITNDFLAVLLRSPKSVNELSSLASGGTAKGVSQKSLLQFKVKLPTNLEEQRKISNLSKTLDGIIALQQSRIEQLQKLKQVYLQKLFP